MIEAKELMLGSLVKTNYDARIYKVWEIRRSGLELDSKIEDCHIHSISFDSCLPIPITEEWLLKFGFEKQTDVCGFKWHKGNFYILQVGKNSFYCDYSLVFAIDYIHQLQNLYFALTQKELE